MSRYTKIISITAMFLMVLGLTVVASAQGRNRRGNNDDYYGNGRYTANLDSAVRNLKNNARNFENVLDRELDNSRYNESDREDNLNDLAERFKRSAQDLDNEYDGYRDMNKSSDEARQVVNYGSQLDRALNRSRLANSSSNLQNSWNSIENDLATIARAYNINYNGQYGRNGRYGNNDRNNRNNRDDRYGRNTNLRSTIVNLRNKSRRFEERVDDYDNDRYRNGNLESLANRFDKAVKDLEDEYDNGRDYNDSDDEVRNVLSLGEQLDREVSRNGVDRNLRNDWNSIEQDLRTLANAYNISYNGNSGRGTKIGDIIRNFPF